MTAAWTKLDAKTSIAATSASDSTAVRWPRRNATRLPRRSSAGRTGGSGCAGSAAPAGPAARNRGKTAAKYATAANWPRP